MADEIDIDEEDESEDLELEDLDEVELLEEDLEEGVPLDDDLGLVDDDDIVLDDEEDGLEIPIGVTGRVEGDHKRKGVADEDDDEDDDDELDDDDVEASLDEILKERLVVDDEDDEDEVPGDLDERQDGSEQVLPKQPGEFVCTSCYLVKNLTQLANAKKRLCRDCV